MDGICVLGMFVYAGLMLGLGQVILRRLAARHMPELALAPSASARKRLLVSIESAVATADIKCPRWIWAALLLLIVLGSRFLPELRISLRTVFLAAFVLLSLIPVLAAAQLWMARARLREYVRRELLRMGVAVCQACGAGVEQQQAMACVECGQSLDEEVLQAADTPRPSSEEKTPTPSVPWRVWIVLILVLLILAAPLPFIMGYLKSTGQAKRDSFRRMQVPGELTINVDKPDRYGIFVPEASASEAAALSVRVVDTRTGQALPVAPTSAKGTFFTADDKELRVVYAVNIPAAGSYQVIITAPTPGEAYVAPSMRGRMFKTLFVVASPLIGLALFVVIGHLLVGRRRSRESEHT